MDKLSTSKRALNNIKNKKKLTDAMDQIILKYDYDTVTIRNLCKVSGVSYGSFYNLFKTKDNFLCYYLTHDFMDYMNSYYSTKSKVGENMNPLEKSVDIFCCCAKYNVEKGLKFVSSFYSPRNASLFPDPERPEQEYSFTPLMQLARQYLKEAQDLKLFGEDADIEYIVRMYTYIFNGVTFNWCISKGKFDIVKEVEKNIRIFLKEYGI